MRAECSSELLMPLPSLEALGSREVNGALDRHLQNCKSRTGGRDSASERAQSDLTWESSFGFGGRWDSLASPRLQEEGLNRSAGTPARSTSWA